MNADEYIDVSLYVVLTLVGIVLDARAQWRKNQTREGDDGETQPERSEDIDCL